MKSIQLIKTGLFIVVLFSILAGCKDEISNTGQVKVTFESVPTNVDITISPVENPGIAIVQSLKIDINGIVTYDLNAGNYILEASGSAFFNNVGFQVKAGQTTSIVYDVHNVGKVQ
ncbi:MAG TPA: hypothetical protein DCL77_04490 [Prolixibacteraceae bacterium]|jgi:hypothetical protein|nr:hypothetical protein [Prolixibacteraceae bacterium]